MIWTRKALMAGSGGGSGDLLPGAVQQFDRHLVLIKLDDVDGGIKLADAEQVGDGKPEQVGENGADNAAVAHENDDFVRVPGGDLEIFRDDPVVQFLKTFAAIGSEQLGVLDAPIHFPGEFFVEFDQAHALPFAERQLAQFGEGHRLQSVWFSDQFGSVPGPLQIAGVNGTNGLVFQRFGDLACLFESLVGQWDVVMTVQTNDVGVGSFAVADQINAASGFPLERTGTRIRR